MWLEGIKQNGNFLGTREGFIGLVIFFLLELELVVFVDFGLFSGVELFLCFLEVVSFKFQDMRFGALYFLHYDYYISGDGSPLHLL